MRKGELSGILHPMIGMGVMLVLVLSAGCSRSAVTAPGAVTSKEQATIQEDPARNDPIVAPSDPTNAVSGGGPTVATDVEEWPPPAPASEVLVGMYGWDPHGGLHNAVWSGTLELKGPCVYLEVARQDGAAAAEGERLRSFLRLPGPLTRYDAATGEIWVAGNGPMTSGDHVTVHGSQGWKREWSDRNDHRNPENMHVFEYRWDDGATAGARAIPVCAAHVSFYAASMHTTDAPDPYVPKTSELSGLEFLDWDEDRGWNLEGADGGILVIEPPCVFYDLIARSHEGWESSRLDEPIRFRLILPRPYVRYDPDTNTLWVAEYGPMNSGDEIWGGGPAGRPYQVSETHNEQCPATADYKAPSIGPRGNP